MLSNVETIKAAVEYWKEKKLDRYEFVLLMITENRMLRSMFIHKLHNRNGIIIDGKEAQQLLELYTLYEFSGKIIVGSLEKPFGRKLQNLLNCGIAMEEELINDVILGAM